MRSGNYNGTPIGYYRLGASAPRQTAREYIIYERKSFIPRSIATLSVALNEGTKQSDQQSLIWNLNSRLTDSTIKGDSRSITTFYNISISEGGKQGDQQSPIWNLNSNLSDTFIEGDSRSNTAAFSITTNEGVKQSDQQSLIWNLNVVTLDTFIQSDVTSPSVDVSIVEGHVSGESNVASIALGAILNDGNVLSDTSQVIWQLESVLTDAFIQSDALSYENIFYTYMVEGSVGSESFILGVDTSIIEGIVGGDTESIIADYASILQDTFIQSDSYNSTIQIVVTLSDGNILSDTIAWYDTLIVMRQSLTELKSRLGSRSLIKDFKNE